MVYWTVPAKYRTTSDIQRRSMTLLKRIDSKVEDVGFLHRENRLIQISNMPWTFIGLDGDFYHSKWPKLSNKSTWTLCFPGLFRAFCRCWRICACISALLLRRLWRWLNGCRWVDHSRNAGHRFLKKLVILLMLASTREEGKLTVKIEAYSKQLGTVCLQVRTKRSKKPDTIFVPHRQLAQKIVYDYKETGRMSVYGLVVTIIGIVSKRCRTHIGDRLLITQVLIELY